MRITAVVIALLLAGEATPTGALKKLGEKKTYAYSIETKVEGDSLGNAAKAMQTAVSGAWEKPDTFVVKVGKAGAEAVHKGGKSVLTLDGKEWTTFDEAEKAAQGKPNAALAMLASVEAPHVEWAEALGRVAGLAKQKEMEENCIVFLGVLTKEAAKEIASELAEGPAAKGDGGRGTGSRGGVGKFSRPGNYGRGGGGNGQVTIKESTGSVKLLVSKDEELPRAIVYTVKATVSVQQGGKPVESEVTITRTIKFEDIDKAKVEIADAAKKKLP